MKTSSQSCSVVMARCHENHSVKCSFCQIDVMLYARSLGQTHPDLESAWHSQSRRAFFPPFFNQALPWYLAMDSPNTYIGSNFLFPFCLTANQTHQAHRQVRATAVDCYPGPKVGGVRAPRRLLFCLCYMSPSYHLPVCFGNLINFGIFGPGRVPSFAGSI